MKIVTNIEEYNKKEYEKKIETINLLKDSFKKSQKIFLINILISIFIVVFDFYFTEFNIKKLFEDSKFFIIFAIVQAFVLSLLLSKFSSMTKSNYFILKSFFILFCYSWYLAFIADILSRSIFYDSKI
jgi:hypothetical protein